MEITNIPTIQDMRKYVSDGNELEGFYEIPDDVYFHPDCPGITRSRLQDIGVSPKYYKIREYAERKETDEMRFGSLFHAAMDNWDDFRHTYKETPEFKGPRGGKLTKKEDKIKALQGWEDENDCKGITTQELRRIELMRKTVENNEEYQAIFGETYREITVFSKSMIKNQLIRCKIDILTFKGDVCHVGDYKTCSPLDLVDHHSIQAKIVKWKYYYQQAFYTYVLNNLGLQMGVKFYFLFVEKDLPFGFRMVELDEEFNMLGLEMVSEDLNTFEQCQELDVWPDYETNITINFPAYLRY